MYGAGRVRLGFLWGLRGGLDFGFHKRKEVGGEEYSEFGEWDGLWGLGIERWDLEKLYRVLSNSPYHIPFNKKFIQIS